ncbi:dTDP-fucopyranose mutase [Polyrhizophydium stewartii]|uniref:dTDP-fucopyranose mutase n=1 Tax=Polyrhizophydium stewartii TaxID=2732419 RepID=A0ABR4NFQ3_9FUNG
MPDDHDLDALLASATRALRERRAVAPAPAPADASARETIKSATLLESLRLDPGTGASGTPLLVERAGTSKLAPVRINPDLRAAFVEKPASAAAAAAQASSLKPAPPSKAAASSSSAIETISIRHVDDTPPAELELSEKEKKKLQKATAGPGWFGMVSTDLTDEVRRDLHILRNRAALDPKRHYKRESSKTLPKVFQIGTIVEVPTDFYSGRLTKRERKQTIVEELLTDAKAKAFMKRKTSEIREKSNNFTRRKEGVFKKKRKDR